MRNAILAEDKVSFVFLGRNFSKRRLMLLDIRIVAVRECFPRR